MNSLNLCRQRKLKSSSLYSITCKYLSRTYKFVSSPTSNCQKSFSVVTVFKKSGEAPHSSNNRSTSLLSLFRKVLDSLVVELARLKDPECKDVESLSPGRVTYKERTWLSRIRRPAGKQPRRRSMYEKNSEARYKMSS